MKDPSKEVLKRIKPSKVEERKLMNTAEAVMKKIKIVKAKPCLGGSAAKGTGLHGDHDIDVYVKFDYKKYKHKNISDILQEDLEKSFKKIEVLHGSRDYFLVRHNAYDVEIVPILDIKAASEASNITDISPLHVAWVKEHSEKADEMRLAKSFCKAGKVYGAESYIQGLSGYVVEILIGYYKTFHALVTDVARWEKDAKKIIDVEGFYIGKNILKELNIAKTVSPLILIDPVQKERNAAAGVGLETFCRLIDVARSYLAKPSKKFFVKKKTSKAELKKKSGKNELLILEATALKGKKDVVGAKLLKAFNFIKKQFSKNDFLLKEAGWEFDGKVLLWFIVKKEKMSKLKRHLGPPVEHRERVKKFKKVWKGLKVLEEDGRLYVMRKRDFMTPRQMIKSLIKNDYVKDRVKAIKEVKK